MVTGATHEATKRRSPGALDLLIAGWGIALALKLFFPSVLATPAVAAWATVFAAICIQSAPYLVLGVIVSTLVAVWIPQAAFQRFLPDRPAVAVPVTSLAGALLPGCECGSVPVAASLMARGVPAAAAVSFLLAAPAINPVVLVATSVAFPGHPIVVFARALASLTTALVVGWAWLLTGRGVPAPRPRPVVTDTGRWEQTRAVAFYDLGSALGMLTVGAAAAATLNVLMPPSILTFFATREVLAILAMALLAVLLAVCSEADAFVAASLTQFSLTSRLVFMTVGPAVDLKLVAMQVGAFGRHFAMRLAPLTLVCATASATLIGAWLL